MKVSKQELLNELNNELKFHQNGGTPYRQKSVELSVAVVKQAADTSVFYDRKSALATVDKLLSEADKDRKSDVSKMVAVVVSDLHSKKTQPAGMTEYVKQKKRNRKPLAFVTK